MTEAYIVDAVRTPTGKRGGGLAEVHPADLGAHVIREVVERNDRPVTSPARHGWPPDFPRPSPVPPSTVSADQASRRSASPPWA